MQFLFWALALSTLVSSASAGGGWDNEYYANPWSDVCATGQLQTPINLNADYNSLPPVPDTRITDFKMPMVKGAQILNVASTIQV